MTHGELGDGETRRARFGREPTAWLRDDARLPIVRDEPARLRDDPELLTTEADRGFGVHDERSGTRRGRCDGSH